MGKFWKVTLWEQIIFGSPVIHKRTKHWRSTLCFTHRWSRFGRGFLSNLDFGCAFGWSLPLLLHWLLFFLLLFLFCLVLILFCFVFFFWGLIHYHFLQIGQVTSSHTVCKYIIWKSTWAPYTITTSVIHISLFTNIINAYCFLVSDLYSPTDRCWWLFLLCFDDLGPWWSLLSFGWNWFFITKVHLILTHLFRLKRDKYPYSTAPAHDSLPINSCIFNLHTYSYNITLTSW